MGQALATGHLPKRVHLKRAGRSPDHTWFRCAHLETDARMLVFSSIHANSRAMTGKLNLMIGGEVLAGALALTLSACALGDQIDPQSSGDSATLPGEKGEAAIPCGPNNYDLRQFEVAFPHHVNLVTVGSGEVHLCSAWREVPIRTSLRDNVRLGNCPSNPDHRTQPCFVEPATSCSNGRKLFQLFCSR